MMSTRSLVKWIGAFLLVSLTCMGWRGAVISGNLLGDPPTFPERAPTPVFEKVVPTPTALLSVDPSSRNASRSFFNTYYSGVSQPAINWTGNLSSCNAGTTSAAFKDAVTLRINYYRAMAGVPADINLSSTYNAKDQKAALMMVANGDLNHSPPPSWDCYSADGAEGAGNSNLALGSYGWDSIDTYMVDAGTDNGPVGHRRWLLYPQTQTMGTGDIPPDGQWSANALWVFDSHLWDTRPVTRDNFVAWPPPGYTPYQVVPARWSFAYPQANFSGTSVNVTKDSQNIPVTPETYSGSYGENTFVWIFNGMSSGGPWPKPTTDESYQISVNNVVIGGQPRNFNYTVTIFDPEHELTCNYAVTPPQAFFPIAGGNGSVQVSATSGCTWEAISSENWITLLSGQTGNGHGIVTYLVAANDTGLDRIGSLTVAGRSVAIRQKGDASTGIVPLLDFLLGDDQ